MRTAAACCILGFGVATASNSEWEEFKAKFGKTYTSPEQEAHRRGIFEKNVEFIEETNAKKLGYELGVNQFSDLLVDEFASQYFGMAKPAAPFQGTHLGRHVRVANETLPDSVDWVAKGAVTPVKNQGQCGSCWAFSTTGSLEGANFIANGKLVSLSEQQFVDCAGGKFGNQGCNGGLMDNAFKFAEQAAICTEASYPYKATGGSCKESSCTDGLTKAEVSGYKDVATDSKEDLMSAVAKQPVSIAIEADLPIFQSYKSGVLTGMCGAKLDHGVLVVGYGTDSGKDYWKVKNSWGTSYGEEGYVRLLRGKGKAGECGILSQPSYPEVKKAEATTIVV